ncbi:MAG TPA: sigma 54-interacting transcriptional regulator [bacterium]|nr:sigma 54-interacting transcriptional regulator [bacterium]
MQELVFERGGKKLFRKQIGDGPVTVGRSPDNSLVLTDPEISRLHCLIERRGGALFLRDLSKNGTPVNGALARERELRPGDSLSVGPWKVTVEGTAETPCEKTVASSPCATQVVGYDEEKRELTTESLELTVEAPGGEKFTKELKVGEATIGTQASCDVVVADPYVSRRHCQVLSSRGALALVDLASTNGTFVGGRRVTRIALPDSGSFTVGKTTVSHRVVRRTERLAASRAPRLGRMIGTSRLIREVFALIERVAPSDATVCVTGESGTGKELAAREIHDRSARRRGPFVAINCGALPPSIIEGQLFGHERGAFTGADARQAGLMEQAKGGTLFLDEIGEMPPELQTRLLRVLESRSVRRVGGDSEISIDARFVAATNRDLKGMVRDGLFREDLFFRLYVVPVAIPPLRERPEDIEALARHFVSELSGSSRSLSPGAVERMLAHPWPGNARELRNTLERSLIMSEGEVLEAASLRIESVSTQASETSDLRGKERAIVTAALEECGGNLSRAARKLGVARTTLQKKIKRHAISVPRREGAADA